MEFFKEYWLLMAGGTCFMILGTVLNLKWEEGHGTPYLVLGVIGILVFGISKFLSSSMCL